MITYLHLNQKLKIMLRINLDANVVGTSFHGHTIKASVNQLRKAFGSEDYYVGDVSEKVQYEWIVEHSSDGVKWNAITIYDWKEYRNYSEDEIIEWHLGAREAYISLDAIGEIEDKLNGGGQN